MLASDVTVDLNMLGAFMEDIIMSNVDSTTIVTIKRSNVDHDKMCPDISENPKNSSIMDRTRCIHELTNHTHGM